MKLLVIGSGAREHAIAWKLAQTKGVQTVFVAPGNAGIAKEEGLQNLNLTDFAALADFVVQEQIVFTVVGPEAPLSEGIVDFFRSKNLPIFGPTQQAAQLESSKDFAKAFMQRHKIPTAAYATFSDATLAHAYVDKKGAPIVIKADGLAAGKGVIVAMSMKEAHQAITDILEGASLGKAGARVVIEDFLEGEEASFIVMADGKNVLPLATSQDHKRVGEGDTGANTGGMGAYSPAPVVTPEIHARAMREIILPAIHGMAKEGTPYSGFLYAGLMIGKDGSVKTVEFNCRLGDPETEPIMMRLQSDLVALIEMALAGKLDQAEANWDRRIALGVVLAAKNYPAAPQTGDEIFGLPQKGNAFLDEEKDEVLAHVFHAASSERQGKILTNGGRVLCVTALGNNLKDAQARAYRAVDRLHFAGMHYRRDIGFRGQKTED